MIKIHRSFISVVGVSLLLIILALGFFVFKARVAQAEGATQANQDRERITLHATGRGNPWINLLDGRDLPTVYTGAVNLAESLNQSRPLALASDDFDEDGVPDLISGYAGSDGGILTLHRGNEDSIFPNNPEAQQRKAAGTFTDSPFLPQARVFALPEAPDFLGTGDFDNDGHWDVVAAARGSNALYLLPGDGRGELRQAQRVDLPGRVTALVTGEINRRDGLADIAVGIVTDGGPQAMIFESPEGAMRGQPEAIGLPAEATALALGQLDEDYPLDLAVAAGTELVIAHGRDRKLSLDKASQAEVSQASFSRFSFPFAITSMAIGNFSGQHRMEVALLSADGGVHLVKERATSGIHRASGETATGQSEVLTAGTWSQATRLVCTRVSGLPMNDLVVVDPADHQLHILVAAPASNAEARGRESAENPSASPAGRVPVSLGVEGEPVAVLPIRLNADAQNDLVILKHGLSGLTVATTAPLATFTVTNINNSGAGSLRQAILDANASPGADMIRFSIPGGGVPTISLSNDLPIITGPVTIDGTTQAGGRVEINGANLVSNGLEITAGSSAVRGMVINRTRDAIVVRTNGDNLIEGNFIGTDILGASIRGNIDSGVVIDNVINNVVGGTTTAARNILSGNSFYGLQISGANARGNLAQGNFIGTNVNGTAALGNGSVGAYIIAPGNTIGGTSAGARNLISGNNAFFGGIELVGAGNLVQGNFIGTDISGTTALGNSHRGVRIWFAANNTIGGTTAAARNVISGNGGEGIEITDDSSTGNLVQGNFIGTQMDGIGLLRNRSHGVLITDFGGEPSNNTIGGTATGAGNTIAFNIGDGVFASVGARNAVLRNSIFSNDGLGIDLGANGVTPNDPGDGDTGANNLQNFPVITLVTGTTINYSLDSTTSNSAYPISIEFFANTACDSLGGNGEGEVFLGSASINGPGSYSFSYTPVAGKNFITATATDNNGNTSEFSRCFTQVPNRPPTIIAAPPLTRQQGSPVSNSIIANVSDPDQPANTLTVTVNGGASATVNGVTVSGISIDPGGDVRADVIASCTATNASFMLTVTDNAAASASATLNVMVTANTPPTLSYNNASVPAGGSIMVSPATASDNGSVTGYSIVRVIPQLNPPPTVNSSGKVSITNAPISGTYNITVRATDNCGATTDATLMLTAQITGEVTGGLLYVLSDRTSGNQIYGYTVDETTGALTLLAGFPISTGGNGDGTSFFSGRMTIDRTNHRLYAVNEGSKTVSAYAINTRTGVLTPLPFSPINVGMGNFLNRYFTVAVHPSGSPLVVGNGNNYQIASYRITETTATPAPGSPYSTDFASPSSIAFSQEGDYVYTGGFAGNAFAGFRVNATTGELTALARPTSFESGMFYPLAYATDTERRLFMANLLGQMRVFTTANGIPSPVSGNPFISGLTQCVHGLLHPNGFYLVADSVGNRVGVYRINGNGSAITLTRVTGSPFAAGGSGTNVLALNQAGTLLIAANGDSRNLTTFSVNPTTGVLTSRGTQPANTLGTSGKLSGLAYLSTGLEADVAPRANGNGQLTVADWVQAGRYAAGLDVEELSMGNAFQRADSAPRDVKGDGEITVADWVQAGRYAAGLDPVMPAAGPTAPKSSAVSTALTQAQADTFASGPRAVRVINTNLERGRRGTVMIELDAQGDENALGFSFNFDPARLQFVSAAVGNGASSATLNLNTSQATNGRVGLALALPAGQVMAVGLRSIVTVTFDAPSSGSAASTTIGFGDQPIRREVSDAAANSLPTTFTSGTVTFTGTAPDNPVPALAGLSPSSAAAGGAAFTLSVTGTNFVNGAVVRWNGSDRSTTFVSSTRSTAAIPASDIATAGTASVTVFNPAPGGGASNALSFAIAAARNPIEIIPASPTTNDQITIRLSGEWPNTCTPRDPVLTTAGNELRIDTSNPGQICGQAFTFYDLTVSAGRLAAGNYLVIARHTSPGGQTELGRRSFTVIDPSPPPMLALIFNGKTRDRVGQGETALSPDTLPDGVFTVALSASSGARTVTGLDLVRSGGGRWNTKPNDGFWVAGAASSFDAPLFNDSGGAVNFSVTGGGSFNLFASDNNNSLFNPGDSFTLTVNFADGTSGSATATVQGLPLTLGFNGKSRDRVGPGETALGPDGFADGVFTVTFPTSGGTRVVTGIDITRSGGGRWNTTPGDGFWVVGVAGSLDDPLLNSSTGAVEFFIRTGSFHLFVSDNGNSLFSPGDSFTLTVSFSNGTSGSATATIPMLPLAFSFNGKARDRVGPGETALGSDGAPDGTFTVILPAGGARTVTGLDLVRGGGGRWNTTPGDGLWVIGAANSLDDPLLNSSAGAVNFPMAGGGSFYLFASDNGDSLFNIGDSFTLTINFADGTTASASAMVGAGTARAGNSSTSTQCAEEDNANISFAGKVAAFTVEATHPTYPVTNYRCEPNFENCGPPEPGFPFTPGIFKLFDDGETVVEAVREATWWRPNGMTAAVDDRPAVDDAHYIRLYRRIAGTSEYPQVLVFYQDGNLRLIPHPPAGASSVCFGSSVIVGPAAPASRPIAEIASVTYLSSSKALEIKYKDGGSATIVVQETTRQLTRVRVLVNYPVENFPFATFRSMFVAEGNADVDRVKWIDAAGVMHDDPILAFTGGEGTDWLFYRRTPSRHNTSAPDIRVRLDARQ